MVDHPAVHLAAQRGHGADREQTVPRPEHLVEKRFRIAEVVAGDALFEHPDVLGQLRGVGAQAPGQRGEQGI